MAAQALEQSALEAKDKDQLLQIAKALGVKGTPSSRRPTSSAQILDATGGADAESEPRVVEWHAAPASTVDAPMPASRRSARPPVAPRRTRDSDDVDRASAR